MTLIQDSASIQRSRLAPKSVVYATCTSYSQQKPEQRAKCCGYSMLPAKPQCIGELVATLKQRQMGPFYAKRFQKCPTTQDELSTTMLEMNYIDIMYELRSIQGTINICVT